jgi:hypothetical protein
VGDVGGDGGGWGRGGGGDTPTEACIIDEMMGQGIAAKIVAALNLSGPQLSLQLHGTSGRVQYPYPTPHLQAVCFRDQFESDPPTSDAPFVWRII